MSRPYVLSWTPSAQRDLQRLAEKVATAVLEFVYGSLADNPQRVGRALQFELAGLHAARRGGYRVIYRIEDDARSVVIVAIDHRSHVYRPR